MQGYTQTPSGLYVPPEALLIGGVMRGTVGSRRAVIAGGGGTSLQDDVPSTCFVLDAADSASYDGTSQTWANVISSPADSTAQSDYDVYRGNTSGATATDPTFNGTAGVAGSYFSFDGGDYFLSTQASNVSPGFFNEIHKTGQSNGWWLAMAFRFVTGTNRFFSNANAQATNHGFNILCTDTLFRFTKLQADGTAQLTNIINTGGSFVNGSDYLVILTMPAARNNYRIWKNTRTASNVAPAASWSSNTNNASNRFAYGTNYASTNAFLPNGARVYALAGGNDYLDDTAAGYIFDYFNDSTGITFA